MKKRIFTILFLIACWTSYQDLTSGSLPAAGTTEAANSQPAAQETAAVPYLRVTVSPGDTLLSITERASSRQPDISQVIRDFSTLNPSVNPNHLKIGETYAFPVYPSNP
ncbi:type IV pilus assembly protein FimV [Sporolactobacillus vineae]|uniref:type IV pilus assembly protein FimV n=1 Tax=Sporolactobacillus vineae TaxID=444463 RepID=UPI000474CA71|nr:hypothetical protein [Sporolactobacillus vineae]